MTPLRQQFEHAWQRYLEVAEARERKRATRLPGWRTRKHRSILATIMLLGCLLMVLASLSLISGIETADNSNEESGAWWRFAGLWFGGGFAWFVTYFLLRTLTGKMSCGFLGLLDERESAWRHQAMRIGFNVLVPLTLGGTMLYQFVLSGMTQNDEISILFMSALIILGASTPTMILGWMLPDDYPDDADEAASTAESGFSTDPTQHTG